VGGEESHKTIFNDERPLVTNGFGWTDSLAHKAGFGVKGKTGKK